MKRHLLILMGAVSICTGFAQNIDHSNCRDGESVEYCKTHKHEHKLLQNPAFRAIFEADQAALRQHELEMSQQTTRATVYTIPVVFHILHNGGAENISYEQVLDALRILNRDYRLQNADANNVHADFQGMPADIEIQFELATIAPNGQCFSGVTRTMSSLALDGDDGQAQVSAIVSGNDVYNSEWDGDMYLNIFVVGEAGGAAGYTYKPSNWLGGSMYNGIWILHDYVGAIGTSYEGRSRALTHEVGHWLNLDHTWGPNNNPGNASSCSDDDAVSDTPNTIGVTGCLLNENTCGPRANVENYMDYSYCSKMYTTGQKNRMRAALTSSTGGRNNLWKAANLSAVGANGNAPLCKAEFSSDQRLVCQGSTVQFSDESYHNVSGWSWTFTGGNPASSTDQNPTVVYDNPGMYNVSLTINNGGQSLSVTKSAYVSVLPGPGASNNIQEGFEGVSALPNANWMVENPDNAAGFMVVSNAAASGSKSVKLDNSESGVGDVDELLSTTYNLAGATEVMLSFKYTFAYKNSGNTDLLRLYVSKDCGETWSLRKNLSGTQLPTMNNTTTNYTPGAADWKLVEISNIPTSYFVDNFRFKFQFTNGGGNDLYIDDINLSALNSVNENQIGSIDVYPNPVSGQAQVNYSLNTVGQLSIKLMNMLGEEVLPIFDGNSGSGLQHLSFNTTAIAPGVYLMHFATNSGSVLKKIVIE